MEYKTILENLCTVSKNIDNHPIVQIDTVKLFYALFKNTFIDISDIENATDNDHEELLNQYRANY
jgi:transcriptional regulator of NAD metabolism